MIKAGKNIAIKVPSHKWQETVDFYQHKVGLAVKKPLKTVLPSPLGI